MDKPTILTGLRANNDLHIGNYFGALLPIIDMANTKAGEYQINLFVPDLHSFITPIDHSQLQTQIMNNLRLFVASGLPLDNPDVHIYRQSYVSAHSELTWILDCFTRFGELSRMTQFKDKAQAQALEVYDKVRDLASVIAKIQNKYTINNIENRPLSRLGNISKILKETGQSQLSTEIDKIRSEISGEMGEIYESEIKLHKDLEEATFGTYSSVALFNYPVLMAADILLYGAKYVPVGDDQSQHLEFTRDIAERLNTKFNLDLFSLPESVQKQHEFFGKDQGLRIKDLVDPNKKMSKSDESGRGIIFLGDNPEDAYKKIMSATTDDKANVAFDPKNQTGISNLLQIYGLLKAQSIEEVAQEFVGLTQYGEFKKVVAEAVAEFLRDFQSKLALVDQAAIDAKLESSEKAMNEISNATLFRVQKAIGLRPK